MEIDPLKFENVKLYLLRTFDPGTIDQVRDRPFVDANDAISAGEASKRAWLAHPAFWLLEAALLILLGLEAWAWKYHASKLREVLRQIPYLSRLQDTPTLLFVVLVLVFVLIVLLFWWYKIPIHDADPLFGRLLQAKIKSDEPPSAGLVADLLGDRRFVQVFERAVDVTLPTEPVSAWDATLSRLADALKDDEIFIQLYSAWGKKAENEDNKNESRKSDTPITRYVKYVARKLLFETILADPDFLYIFQNISRRRQRLVKWLSKIRWEKAKDVLGKEGKESVSRSAEVLSVANVFILFLVLVVTIFGKWQGGVTQISHGDDNAVCVKCEKGIAEIHSFVEQLVMTLSQPKPAPPVHVTVQASAPVTSPASTDLKIPSKIEVSLPSELRVTSDINIKPQGGANIGLVPSPPPAASHIQGDDFITFRGDDNQTSKPLVLHLVVDTGVVACSYDAKLVRSGTWPPDPIEINLSHTQAKENVKSCPPIGDGTAVHARRTPVYSSVLRAYLSIDEESKRAFKMLRLKKVGEDLLVIRIHPEDHP